MFLHYGFRYFKFIFFTFRKHDNSTDVTTGIRWELLLLLILTITKGNLLFLAADYYPLTHGSSWVKYFITWDIKLTSQRSYNLGGWQTNNKYSQPEKMEKRVK